jgi:tetratricopeptide (TPR) repeat protein
MLVRAWLRLSLIAALALFAPRARADADTEARQAFEHGVSASSDGRWQDARRAFLHSLDLVVKPSTLFNLAVTDLKLGLTQEAIDALDRFRQLANPKQHAAMLERAATLRAEAERSKEAAVPAPERARSLIEPGNLSPEARDSYVQGRDAYARGDDKVALEAFERAHRESGRNELLFHIGIAADRLREDERAVDAFSRFLDLFPEVPEAEQARRHLDRLNRVLAEQSKPEPADTIAARRDEGASAAPSQGGSKAELGAPRALLIVGAVLAGAAIGSAGWLIERSSGRPGRCLDGPRSACSNFADVQREQRAALGLTISLSVTSLALLTGGGVWLNKRKQQGVALRDVNVQLSRDALLGSARLSF